MTRSWPRFSWRAAIPARRWWHRVNRDSLRADLMAGLTGSIILVPQGVAFATIAGMPPEYGLYTAMVPAIVAALFGSSWHLVSGPTTAISIVVLATLSPMAEPGSAAFVSLAITLSLMVGVVQLALGLLRLGVLVNFVSHTVVVGFTAGAAVLIACSQVKNFFGLSISRQASAAEVMTTLATHVQDVDPASTSVATATLLVSVLSRRVWPRVPHMIVGMVAGSVLAWLMVLVLGPAAQVPTVGALDALFPPVSMPDLSPSTLSMLLPSALALSLLALTEAVSIARAMALKSGQRIDGNQEFIGQGLSNAIGSFFSAYPSSGSFNRSGLNQTAGAQTPLAAVFSAVLLVGVLYFIASLAAHLPVPAMAGVLFLVAWGLADWHHIGQILRGSRGETAVLVVTFISTLVMQLEFAIYLGVLLSLMLYLSRTSRPGVEDVKPDPEPGRYHFSHDTGLPDCPQLKMLRINGSLFFGAVDHVDGELTAVDARCPTQKHLLIVAPGINFVDMAGADLLEREARRRRRMGGGLYLFNVKPEVMDKLRTGGHAPTLDDEHVFAMKSEPLAALYPRLDAVQCERCQRRIFRQCHERLPDGRPRVADVAATAAAD
jgi:sulfate permease, SulP family